MSVTATVKMYDQQNLGDCFLLTFTSGDSRSHILIDCGSYENGNDEREIEIAKHIGGQVKGDPFRIVLTHQHQDHLSGFISAAAEFKKMNPAEIWFSYLDDPQSKTAIAIRDVTKQFWQKNMKNKKQVRKHFSKSAQVKRMLDAKDNIDLFAEAQTGGEAITNLLSWSKNKRKFLLPGNCFDLPGLPPDTVKVYVLGPPVDEEMLRKMNPGKNDVVQGLDASSQLASLDVSMELMADALNAVSPEIASNEKVDNFPFSKKFTHPLRGPHPLKKTYENTETWRRIDHDWLSEIGRVSLHMDNLTNNSSLVLAFELVESGKVLLFAGDAQIGNWKSWQNVKFRGSRVKADELLARTVLYKAGHHSSLNATLRQSLELMDAEELVIMIPVNSKVSKRRKFHMLKPGMLMGYNRKSHGRVLRSDTIYHAAGNAKYFKFQFGQHPKKFFSRLEIGKDDRGKHLYVEYAVTS